MQKIEANTQCVFDCLRKHLQLQTQSGHTEHVGV